jgi:hypothetical protein
MAVLLAAAVLLAGTADAAATERAEETLVLIATVKSRWMDSASCAAKD